ncbi:DoxX family protein [Runella aurantiaca]|uniref:DoxX family protein n=1 Tax=Runella aurantiaca TaxID=2282308 RepID=A0A369HZS2_9BACT|nr:DoxX family protein [Runella aurantiaca]RDB03021.1 DoxX family protein [Runella aurantiaca]
MELFGFSVLLLSKLFFAAFNGILFTQSGLDKVFHYQGNLDYFKGHFKKSPLASTVGLLMPVITLLETSAGVTSLVGLLLLLLGHDAGNSVAATGMGLGGLSLVCLFFGQRVAQDYAGAATLVPYFLMTMAGFVLYAF